MAVVECFGLPGAGKTFIHNKLTKGLALRGCSTISRKELILYGLRKKDQGPVTNAVKKFPAKVWHRVIHEDYCLKELLDYLANHPVLAELMFNVLSNAKVSGHHARLIVDTLSRTFVEYQLIDWDYLRGRVMIADEWFCHRFYTLFGSISVIPSQQQTEVFVEQIPLSDLAIFIATPPELCLERMHRRNRLPTYLQDKSEKQLSKIMRTGYQGLSLLVEKLDNTEIDLIVFDGSSSIDYLIEKVLKLVEPGA